MLEAGAKLPLEKHLSYMTTVYVNIIDFMDLKLYVHLQFLL
jgi:hypothetical protein